MPSLSSITAFSSSSSSSSSSPTPHDQWMHDVFLSFRGDTCMNFTDHLYDALTEKGINTFRDEDRLERGKPIRPELLKAIEESRFAIVVLSRDYASSTWCLDELAKIVERMKETTLTVLPVFYNVDPSDLRKQRKTFAEAFVKHEEKENIEKVQKWKDALIEVGDVSGWHIQDSHEAPVIRDIVGKIFGILNRSSPNLIVSKDFVGIDSRVEEMMNSYLGAGLNDVRFIGIWGMGGIGKTTLAQAIYRMISNQFEDSTFLANVREEVGKHGLVHLQKELLSNTLLESGIKIRDVNMGIDMIKNRLRHRKVLIILDDVDQSEQLKALAGGRGWFGPGSRIIITTRDECLLIKNEIFEDKIYKAKELNNDEACLLFSQKAFKKDHPTKDYLELSNKILNYTNGLPLALEVLGSFLFRRSEDEWRSALCRLEKNPNRKIFDTLQISLDGLEEQEKTTFLDIACFFKGEDKDLVASKLETCVYHPNVSIEVLISKSLITISGRKLWMHDLLEELGREIRHETLEGKGSKLCHSEDACEDPCKGRNLCHSEDACEDPCKGNRLCHFEDACEDPCKAKSLCHSEDACEDPCKSNRLCHSEDACEVPRKEADRSKASLGKLLRKAKWLLKV